MAAISLTYTGSFFGPFFFPLIGAGPIVMPPTPGTGLPVQLNVLAGEKSAWSVLYTEAVSVPPAGRLLSISFNDLQNIYQSGFVINGVDSCTSILAPKLKRVFGPFSLLGAILTSITFPELIEVRGLMTLTNNNAILSVSFPKLSLLGDGGQAFTGSTAGLIWTSFSMPLLKDLAGTFSLGGPLTSVDLSSLQRAIITFTITANVSGSLNLTLPALTYVTSPTMGGAGMTQLHLPVLTDIMGSAFSFSSATNMTICDIPAFVNSAGGFSGSNLTNLVTLNFGLAGVTKSILGNVAFNGCKLNQASVDRVLHTIASLDGTNGTTSYGTGRTVSLNGGTNSTPSATGLADKAIIVARGGTVTNN